MSKKLRNILIGIGAVVLVVLLTSPRIKLFESNPENPGGGQEGDFSVSVEAIVIRPEKIDDKILATGTVLANEEVELNTEISGKIEHIMFKEGGRVQKGELLLKINDAELQAQLLKLDFQERLAEDIEQRRKKLLENNLISPEDHEIALNELNSIKAEIQLVKARIDKTEIRAPFDGTVGLRYVSEGSYVSTDTRIANFQDAKHVKIDFSIPEKYANSARKGQLIHFMIAGSDERYAGKIYAIEPKIDPATRTLQLRAISPNKDGKVIPGAFAEVELVLQHLDSALMVPTEALVPILRGHQVYLFRNGRAQPQSVEIGLRTGTKVQITAGLQVSDTLITSGILQMVPGLPVRISNFN
ncbi:MAG: efflux RND transporter periplasmic adaptor subunit [Bacteroidota bacterium]